VDEIVKAALKKWPTVPHCYGWLALDARGQWFMRDERIQRAGPFPRIKGSVIRHDKLLEFIHRNYECDAQGCWFFQNGPQRVYVELEAAPLVCRVSWSGDTLRVQAHTGEDASVRAAWLDEHGRLFLHGERGFEAGGIGRVNRPGGQGHPGGAGRADGGNGGDAQHGAS